jgi:NAD(P)-dependent dehydrogenase (short-subunit alcohol dehydrogenase family)
VEVRLDGKVPLVTGVRAGVGNAKAALMHLTRQMAAEQAPKVRVNAIAPGFVKPDMNRGTWEHMSDGELARRSALQRLGTPEDIADAALFLVSDLARSPVRRWQSTEEAPPRDLPRESSLIVRSRDA